MRQLGGDTERVRQPLNCKFANQLGPKGSSGCVAQLSQSENVIYPESGTIQYENDKLDRYCSKEAFYSHPLID